jgi:hypothetical protein
MILAFLMVLAADLNPENAPRLKPAWSIET